MTELLSAHEYAMAILQRPLKYIAATKIQKTWRSMKIEQMAEVERARAQMHKVENLVGPSWKSKCSDKIEDLLEGMDVIKDKTLLTFSETCEARTKNGFTYREFIHKEDGKEKGTTKFTLLVNSWTSYLGNKKEFFNGPGKVWADDPSSKDWIDHLERVILLLENKVPVMLWGQGGGYKKLYPSDKRKISELKDYWRLHQLKKEIAKLQGEEKAAKQGKRKRKRYQMNPLAEEFFPEVLYAYAV